MEKKIVADAAVWTEMKGDSDLEKKLNSYLTIQFNAQYNVSPSEYLEEAKYIIRLVRNSSEY